MPVPKPHITQDEIQHRIERHLSQALDTGKPAMELSEVAELQKRLQLLKEDCRRIGQFPPQPPTLRAKIGGLFVSVVRRFLFWYTPPLQYAIGGTVQVAEQMLRHIEEIERIQEQARVRFEQVTRAQQEEITSEIRRVETRYDALLASEIRRIEARYDAVLTERLQNTELRVQALRREMVVEARRVSYLLEEARRHPVDSPLPATLPPELEPNLDSLYVAFEDELRGPRAEILENLREYLPFLRKGAAGAAGATLLDIGCGRGEWLDLLRQEGFSARGVDTNLSMVEECRVRGLDATQADGVEYLRGLPSESLTGLTAFHVVEHLPYGVLIRFLDEVVRVLQPGGVAIFETPNPNNLLVGSRNFYFDPTHRNPIPCETLRFLVESRGMCRVEVLPLHPCDPCNHVPENGSVLAAKFNEYFYGPQDYAVIGWKV